MSLEQPTIAEVARQCFMSFEQLLQLLASEHPRGTSLLEDQQARLSLWASSMDVFAAQRASLDHRLRDVPDIQEIVIGLLETLQHGILAYVTTSDGISSVIIDAKLKTLDGSINLDGKKLEDSLRNISKEIGLLYKLLNTVRRASRESQDLKASRTWTNPEDEHKVLENAFLKQFSQNIKDQFPGISDIIRERLAMTMVIRRRRILYRRSRYSTSPIHVRETVSQPVLKAPPDQQQIPFRSKHVDIPESLESPAKKARSTVKSLAPSATTITEQKFKRAMNPSVVSASKTIPLSSSEGLIFPPAPRARGRHKPRQLKDSPEPDTPDTTSHVSILDEVICPYCFYALPGTFIYNDTEWQLHVKNDLDAYVCLFEECDKPEELYNRSQDWLKHMREHALRWRCKSKSHSVVIFDNQLDYESHMRQDHKGRIGPFTDLEIRVLSERNARVVGTLFTSCPFCGTEEPKDQLEEHIVGHLRALALKSLPPYYEESGEGNCGSDPGTSSASGPRTRSTIRQDRGARTSQDVELDYPTSEDEEPQSACSSTADAQTSRIQTDEHISDIEQNTFSIRQEIRPHLKQRGKGSVNTNNAADARRYKCRLAGYGCQASFTGKSEWKRHHRTQHFKLGFWRCDLCPILSDKSNEGAIYHSDFSRKDLFTGHLRRTHVEDGPVNDANISEHQERCYHLVRPDPPESACLFCSCTFSGPMSWEDNMDHVGRHMDENAITNNTSDHSQWRSDKKLEEWMIDEGLIARTDDGKWCIGDGRPLSSPVPSDDGSIQVAPSETGRSLRSAPPPSPISKEKLDSDTFNFNINNPNTLGLSYLPAGAQLDITLSSPDIPSFDEGYDDELGAFEKPTRDFTLFEQFDTTQGPNSSLNTTAGFLDGMNQVGGQFDNNLDLYADPYMPPLTTFDDLMGSCGAKK